MCGQLSALENPMRACYTAFQPRVALTSRKPSSYPSSRRHRRFRNQVMFIIIIIIIIIIIMAVVVVVVVVVVVTHTITHHHTPDGTRGHAAIVATRR
jgi:hypothetical protein